MDVDHDRIAKAVTEILLAIGEDPAREGLAETPERVARFWQEFLNSKARIDRLTSFESVKVDQMIIVSGIEAWSMCEHHLIPFRVDVTAAYICRGKIIGLSKIPRIVQREAGKLQLQERLVEDVAASICDAAGTPDVAVIASGVHLCTVMRGARSNCTMTSSAIRGVFQTSAEARAEFIALHRDQVRGFGS